jgi:hypothetical protein
MAKDQILRSLSGSVVVTNNAAVLHVLDQGVLTCSAKSRNDERISFASLAGLDLGLLLVRVPMAFPSLWFFFH